MTDEASAHPNLLVYGRYFTAFKQVSDACLLCTNTFTRCGGEVNDTAREKDVGFAALDPGVSKWILISVSVSVYGGVYW